ncbi:MAG: hypothetical protein WAN35_17740 [Terracidiphilus sp.]
MSEALQYFASTQSRIEQATAGLPEEAKKQRMHPGGGGYHFSGESFAEGAAFLLFHPVSLSFVLFSSLHERIIIICKQLRRGQKPLAGGLEFVVSPKLKIEMGANCRESREQGPEKVCWLRFLVSAFENPEMGHPAISGWSNAGQPPGEDSGVKRRH